MAKRSVPRRRTNALADRGANGDANGAGNGINRDKLCKAVLAAAEAAGKQFGDKGLVSYLEAQAIATPSPFLTLLGKVLAEDKLSETAKITHIEIIAPQIEDAIAQTMAQGVVQKLPQKQLLAIDALESEENEV